MEAFSIQYKKEREYDVFASMKTSYKWSNDKRSCIHYCADL